MALGPQHHTPKGILPVHRAWRMFTAEIGTAQFADVTASCIAEIFVPPVGGYIPCTGEIGSEQIPAPTNALGVHLNQGRVIVTWQHAEPERVDYFEVYAALNVDGPFYPYPTGRSKANYCFLKNVPLGSTLYLQVRAVGVNGLLSDFTTVKRGKFETIEGLLSVTAISGSVILKDTTFSSLDKRTGEVITFRAKDRIELP